MVDPLNLKECPEAAFYLSWLQDGAKKRQPSQKDPLPSGQRPLPTAEEEHATRMS